MLSLSEPVQIAIITGIFALVTPLAVELLRSRIKARDAAAEAERESKTREVTERAARDTVDELKLELSEAKAENRELTRENRALRRRCPMALRGDPGSTTEALPWWAASSRPSGASYASGQRRMRRRSRRRLPGTWSASASART